MPEQTPALSNMDLVHVRPFVAVDNLTDVGAGHAVLLGKHPLAHRSRSGADVTDSLLRQLGLVVVFASFCQSQREGVVQILISMNAPGCQWLALTEVA